MEKTNKWKYDGSIDMYPISNGEIWSQNGCKLAVNDLRDGIPDFMLEADILFIDPPWNLGNVNSFVTKAGSNRYCDDFIVFYKLIFETIARISPRVVYLEIGKQYLADFIIEVRKIYKYVTFYNSTYYRKKDNICYIIRASNKPQKPKVKLDGMDEEDIISWVCKNEEFNCIGDFVIGRGLVGYYAHLNKKRFVGCEMNPNRIAVLLNRIGGDWDIVKNTV